MGLSVFDRNRALVFMHIPKSAGTSLDIALQTALGTDQGKRFFGTVLHGDIREQDYLSWEDNTYCHLAIGDRFMEDNSYVIAHASYQELFARHPDGQFVTFFREPVSRIISLRSFLRGFTDEAVCRFGTYGMFLLRARLSLKQFLEHPFYAASCDNVATRMLLHPHPLIPSNHFISPRDDERLIAEAASVLDNFAFFGAVENTSAITELSESLQCHLDLPVENESICVPAHLRCELYDELDKATMDLLQSHSRLDLQLWKMAMKTADENMLMNIRTRTIAKCVAKHSVLLSNGQLRGPRVS